MGELCDDLTINPSSKGKNSASDLKIFRFSLKNISVLTFIMLPLPLRVLHGGRTVTPVEARLVFEIHQVQPVLSIEVSLTFLARLV